MCYIYFEKFMSKY